MRDGDLGGLAAGRRRARGPRAGVRGAAAACTYLDARRAGALDLGDLVLTALAARAPARARARRGALPHVLVDDVQDLAGRVPSPGPVTREHRGLTAAGDTSARVRPPRTSRTRAAGRRGLRLQRSHRSPHSWRRAGRRRRQPGPARAGRRGAGGELRFWRCSTSARRRRPRAARSSAVREGAQPSDVAARAPRCGREGQAIGSALDERAVPYSSSGVRGALRARQVNTWLRLSFVDPSDSARSLRASPVPPIRWRGDHLAPRADRAAASWTWSRDSPPAMESPQIDPAARERILGLLKLHRQIAARTLTRARTSSSTALLNSGAGLRRQQLLHRAGRRRRAAAQRGADRRARRAGGPPQPPGDGRELPAITAVADAGLGEVDAAPAIREPARRERAALGRAA